MTIKRKVKANALSHLEKLTGGKLTLAKLPLGHTHGR